MNIITVHNVLCACFILAAVGYLPQSYPWLVHSWLGAKYSQDMMQDLFEELDLFEMIIQVDIV